MESYLFLGMMGYLSYEDIKSHKIRDLVVLIFSVVALILHLLFERISLFSLLGGMLTGLLFVLLSKLTGEKIGMGDGLVLMLTGIYLGFWKNILLIWLSTFLMSVFGIMMIILKGKRWDTRIPYIPFLLAGCFLFLILGKGRLL